LANHLLKLEVDIYPVSEAVMAAVQKLWFTQSPPMTPGVDSIKERRSWGKSNCRRGRRCAFSPYTHLSSTRSVKASSE